MKLSDYLVARGSKMLSAGEAAAFGVPFPLVKGWAAQHGDLVLTMVHLEAAAHASKELRPYLARKAQRGILAAARAL